MDLLRPKHSRNKSSGNAAVTEIVEKAMSPHPSMCYVCSTSNLIMNLFLPENIGTPLKSSAIKVMLLGSGELGKEVVIEFQRFGIEVIAVDKYDNAPAMQVAHRSYTVPMLDGDALRKVIESEKPDFIVPEVEAIATDVLIDLEDEGYNVIPTANAARLTMNREGIRTLAAETLELRTSPYRFAHNTDEFREAVKSVGIPCVVKPLMSSSGKGQSLITSEEDIENAWRYAQEGGRSGGGKVIVEGFVDFDYEITLLTVKHKDGVSFCEPIGHRQEHGDYHESWQPHPMHPSALKSAQEIAEKIVNALGGRGIFGVEFFVKGEIVFFSEVSPRPHDTGMVTMISQDLSEFALHVRAILGLPIPHIRQLAPSASSVVLVKGDSSDILFYGLDSALSEPDTQVRLFGKPEVRGERRMGVCLAKAATIEEARAKATRMSAAIRYECR
jgi:phosphoribosylglycinamide formyltransferase 2